MASALVRPMIARKDVKEERDMVETALLILSRSTSKMLARNIPMNSPERVGVTVSSVDKPRFISSVFSLYGIELASFAMVRQVERIAADGKSE